MYRKQKEKLKNPQKNIINDIHDECARLVSHLPATKRIDCSSTASEHFLHYRSRPFRPLLARLSLESHLVSSHFLRVLLACLLSWIPGYPPCAWHTSVSRSSIRYFCTLCSYTINCRWRSDKMEEERAFIVSGKHLPFANHCTGCSRAAAFFSVFDSFLFVRIYHEPIYKFIHNHQHTFLS